MLHTSSNILKVFAACVWYAGGFVLVLKGGALLMEAEALNPKQSWAWMAVLTGISAGGVKAKLLFINVCKKNLIRIDALEQPMVWQFYRPRFFLFLFIMITLGGGLSRMAHGHYPFLISVAVLDLSIAAALLISSYVFWVRPTGRSRE